MNAAAPRPKLHAAPLSERGARKREAILRAAAELVADKGPGDFTIGALIEKTGIPRMTIYRHWPSRDRLLAVAMERLPHPVELPDDSQTRILKTAASLLIQRGAGGFAVDAVAAQAGIAKTTIYRYWSGRADLLTAAIRHLGGATRIPDTGSLRSDLIEFFMAPLRELKEQGGELANLPEVIEAAKRDPELAEVGARVHEVTLNALKPMLERAQARGEMRTDRDLGVITNMLYGAMFIHGALGHGAPENFVPAMVDTFLDGVRPR